MITVYTKQNCANCVIAKNLLKTKKVEFSTIEIIYDNSKSGGGYISREEFMSQNPNVRELPFIVDGDTIVGNYKQLLSYLNKLSNV